MVQEALGHLGGPNTETECQMTICLLADRLGQSIGMSILSVVCHEGEPRLNG